MIDYTSTQRPPFARPFSVFLADCRENFKLSPEQAGRILHRVMATIQAQQAETAATLAAFDRVRECESTEADEDADAVSALAWRRFLHVADDA